MLNPGPAADEALHIAEQQSTAVDRLVAGAPSGDLPLGLSAAFWLDLCGYDPVQTAAAVDRPMLILQGGRDYQVTVEHDLARWRDGLGDRPDVGIRVYPEDDHLFFPGTGPATPESYYVLQHVDGRVVADIADWLRSVR